MTLQEKTVLLKRLTAECVADAKANNIKLGNIRSIVPGALNRTWGECELKPDGKYVIVINNFLLDESNDLKKVKDTVMHELLHTCKDCMCHTGEWKRLANIMNSKGYNITRTGNVKSVGLSQDQLTDYNFYREEKTKYKFRCTCCGVIVRKERKSKFTEHPENYRCGRCHGKFEQIK